jgi:gliding motility-associated-like protein
VASSAQDCSDTARTLIEVEGRLIYYIPNSFTPDGDDYNQTFKPVFTTGYDVNNFTMLIFNRWGEIVFESHDANAGWDGTYGVDSDKIVEGTYVWKIEFKTSKSDERKSLIGHVTLIK